MKPIDKAHAILMKMLPTWQSVPFLLASGVSLALLLLRAECHPYQVLVHASSTDQQHTDGGAQYAGDAACARCHQKEVQSYFKTAHHLTSQPATKDTVLGSFAKGQNLLTISNAAGDGAEPHLYFEMESRDDGLYETAVAEMGAKRLLHTEKMDMLMGSGTRGQTYLFWRGNELFELPVSYWTQGRQWINSPGYKDGTANFARRADPRCMECHASYIRALSRDPQTNIYDRNSLMLGISCEVCHGRGKSHVNGEEAQSAHAQPTSQTILNPAKLDRDTQVDQCALCHNGTGRAELNGAFSFIPGQPLDHYFAPAPPDSTAQPDVHGNQVGLLKKSRCFLSSPTMTCSTCHQVHAPELAAADYSSRCLSCHQWQSCGEAKRIGATIVRDCVDCHMPLQETKSIVSVTAGKELRTSIRNHWIKVYPQADHAQ